MSQYDFTLGDELEDKPRKTTLSIHGMTTLTSVFSVLKSCCWFSFCTKAKCRNQDVKDLLEKQTVCKTINLNGVLSLCFTVSANTNFISEARGKSLHHITKTLEGFHLAKDPPTVRKHYPPPQIPADFEPIHHGPKKERRRFEEPKANLYKEDRKEHSGASFCSLSVSFSEHFDRL